MFFRLDRCGLIVFLLLLLSTGARADVSLLLYEAVGGAKRWYSFGHVAIHLSNVCADSGNRLRLCQPGESGVVLSAYRNFGARENYEWLALPLWPSLYGVESEDEVPLYADMKVRSLLVESYRRERLSSLIPAPATGQTASGDWSYMLGAALSRTIYSFTVKTTPDQDAALVEEFNRAPNVNNFSFITSNCSDFVAKALNQYFPRSVRKSLLIDFGVMTPKAVAKSFTRYAAARPELLYSVTKYEQAPGPISRSHDARHVTEELLFSPKYSLPLVYLKMPIALAFLSSYFITGRFDPDKEWRKHALDSGAKQMWKRYKADFARLLSRAVADGYFADSNEVKTFFRDLEANSEPAFDETGALILRVSGYGQDRILGITRSNILSRYSDRRLAYQLMLARVNAGLSARKKNRVSLETLKGDWELLTRLAEACAGPTERSTAPSRRRHQCQPRHQRGGTYERAAIEESTRGEEKTESQEGASGPEKTLSASETVPPFFQPLGITGGGHALRPMHR